MPKQKKILVADDERPIANALRLKLESVGFFCNAVNDGQQALDAMSKEKYDLLLLDLMMPVMDGFGVLEKLKEKGNKVPVIVTSNLGQEEDKKKADSLGAIDYFIKSDTPLSHIVEAVKKYLSK